MRAWEYSISDDDCFFSNFATKTQTAEVKHQKLDHLINRIQIITNKNKPIPHECLDAISNQLAKESPNNRQSLALLHICRNILKNRIYLEAISTIFMKLQRNEKRDFRKEHFVLVMQLNQANGDINGAEETLKEMQKAKIQIKPYAQIFQVFC